MRWLWIWFRKRYEAQINLRHGVLQFLGNFALLQLARDEYVELSAPSKNSGLINVTANDARPMLTYKYWPKGMEWREEMPLISVILEERRILRQINVTPVTGQAAVGLVVPLDKDTDFGDDWVPIEIDDPWIQPLHPMFQAFAFYQPMRPEHKRKAPDAKV